jgi:predicted metal-dependent phosphoesterase TrpH
VPDYRRPGSPEEEQRRRDQALRRAARGEEEPKKRTLDAAPADGVKERTSAVRKAGYRDTGGPPVIPPHPSRVDLHTHSDRSDGLLEPRQLVNAAAAAGVRIMALCDHDTLAGVRELSAEGTPLPLVLIAGVEINSLARRPELHEGELHILGLGVDLHDDAFEDLLRRQREHRAARFKRIVDRLADLNYPIDQQVEVLLADHARHPDSAFGRPQLARCLVAAGYVASVDDAMQRLLLRGKPAYIPREGVGPQEAISAIRAAGGLPVLAHFPEADARFELVKELVGMGLGGLEVYYRRFDQDVVDQMRVVARDLKLVPTGGSDYHGDGMTYEEAHASLYVPDDVGTDLLSLLGSPPTYYPPAIPRPTS